LAFDGIIKAASDRDYRDWSKQEMKANAPAFYERHGGSVDCSYDTKS
jgi:hypothetical protein